MSRRASAQSLLHNSGHVTEQRISDLMEIKDSHYRSIVLNPNACLKFQRCDEILAGLKNFGFKLAVASASKNAQEILEKECLLKFFDYVSTGNFCGPAKPQPDQLIDVAEKIKIKTECCIVVEDSENGIRAASSAGMWNISIGAHLKQNDRTILSFESLDNIIIQDIKCLLHDLYKKMTIKK